MSPITMEEARREAIEWSHTDTDGLSLGEIAEVQTYFSALALKFPELEEEFRENGII